MAKVAVVGAGIAGLSCARALTDAGHQVRVFEKSRGLGGRMATRHTAEGSYDHGVQYFTVRSPAFQALVKTWMAEGMVAPYAGRIAQIKAGEVHLLAPAGVMRSLLAPERDACGMPAAALAPVATGAPTAGLKVRG